MAKMVKMQILPNLFSVLAPKITTDRHFQVQITIFLNDVTSSDVTSSEVMSSDVTSSIYKIADVRQFLTSQFLFGIF